MGAKNDNGASYRRHNPNWAFGEGEARDLCPSVLASLIWAVLANSQEVMRSTLFQFYADGGGVTYAISSPVPNFCWPCVLPLLWDKSHTLSGCFSPRVTPSAMCSHIPSCHFPCRCLSTLPSWATDVGTSPPCPLRLLLLQSSSLIQLNSLLD